MKHLCLLLFAILSIQNYVYSQSERSSSYHLIPWPKSIVQNDQKFIVNENFSIAIPDLKNRRIVNATTKFLRRLSGRTGIFLNQGFAVSSADTKEQSFLIHYERKGETKLFEDESYLLEITNQKIELTAETDIGIVRGIETLLQLLSSTPKNYFFSGVLIKDMPRFPWRGLMIDVARHYEPMDVLKRNLDAMAAVKLNVFHWHLSDDQGFRVEVKALPKLHELASDGLYYTHEQIKEIVAYADRLGIRVIPEFDVPGHATAILTAYPEIGSKKMDYRIERGAGIFDPTLDPTNDKTYELIDALFSEMAPLFPDAYFHIGGDENKGKHWNENEKITAFKQKNKFKTNHELQTYFNIKIQKILERNNKIMMGWDEIFQPNLPKDVVIHSWRGKEAMLEAAKLGYKTVLSKGFYIDLLESVKIHYHTEPIPENHDLTDTQLKNILGGEATMWSEMIVPETIDSRIWPRTIAIAERLWSERDITNLDHMLKRLETISYTLEELGITHIRNRNVILRRISENQTIDPLITLTKICEPLKAYERKKGGTIYKSHSPLTRFTNACTPDAIDAIIFNEFVENYIQNPQEESKKKIIQYLDLWITNHKEFRELTMNPSLTKLLPLSQKLAVVSGLLKNNISEKSKTDKSEQIEVLLKELDQPFADTELAILNGLEKLYHSILKIPH